MPAWIRRYRLESGATEPRAPRAGPRRTHTRRPPDADPGSPSCFGRTLRSQYPLAARENVSRRGGRAARPGVPCPSIRRSENHESAAGLRFFNAGLQHIRVDKAAAAVHGVSAGCAEPCHVEVGGTPSDLFVGRESDPDGSVRDVRMSQEML